MAKKQDLEPDFMFKANDPMKKAINESIARVGFEGCLQTLAAIYEPRRGIAQIIDESGLFPCMVVVGRKNAAKVRKVRKKATQEQNNWGINVFYARNFCDFTIMRANLKHKGYPLLLTMVDPDDWEIPSPNQWRYIRVAYKSFDEYMSIKGKVNDPEWLRLANHIQQETPMKATGQQTLILSEIRHKTKAKVSKPFPVPGSKAEPVKITNQTSLF